MFFLITFIFSSIALIPYFNSGQIEMNAVNIASAIVIISILSYLAKSLLKSILIIGFAVFIGLSGYAIAEANVKISKETDWNEAYTEVKDYWKNRFKEGEEYAKEKLAIDVKELKK